MLQGMLGVSHPVRILQEGQETKGEVAITKVGSRVGPVPTALKADPLKPRPKGAPRDAGAKQVNPALDGKFEQ
jgi:hypothetical protein